MDSYAHCRRMLGQSPQCKHMLCREPLSPPFIGPQCHRCLGRQGFAIYQTPLLRDQLGVVATKFHSGGTVLGQYRGVNQLTGPNYDYAISVDGIVVDAFDPHHSNWTRYCNHAAHGSRHCNAELVRRGERFIVMATSDILIGDEILFDYGDDYWRTRDLIPNTMIRTTMRLSRALPSYIGQNQPNMPLNFGPSFFHNMVCDSKPVQPLVIPSNFKCLGAMDPPAICEAVCILTVSDYLPFITVPPCWPAAAD